MQIADGVTKGASERIFGNNAQSDLRRDGDGQGLSGGESVNDDLDLGVQIRAGE